MKNIYYKKRYNNEFHLQGRDADSHSVRDHDTQLPVCPVPGGPGLLVLPLLSGKVQEI